jgi:hypothetical protein
VQLAKKPSWQDTSLCILVASVAAVLFYSIGCASQTRGSKITEAPEQTLNVRDFGAKGDGVTDDYDALQAAAAAVCQVRGATLLFPEGTYLINRYRITGGHNQNTVQNIRYIGCRGTTISGVRARIEVEGDFHRTADHIDDDNIISYETSIIPFEMINSSGFRIIGFDLAGNVEKMTRDPKVVEGSASAILTTNCQDYFIEDVRVDGFAADGITLGGNSESADERAHLLNVTSTHNARLGLAMIQVRDAQIMNSVFSQNGRTGRYGSHAPAAGVAVTPVRSAPEENLSTGLITFDKCRFEENVGPQFYSGLPERVHSITVRNSTIKSTLPDTGKTAFMSVPKVGVVFGNTFDIAAGRTVALAVYRPERYASIDNLLYRGNTFRLGDNKGITPPLVPAPVELVGNEFIIDSPTADRNLLRLDYVKSVVNNSFFESNSGYSGVHYTILYEKGDITVRNNRYDTNRSAPGYFDVYYGQQVVPSGDFFPHPANFQPHYVNAAIQHVNTPGQHQ